MRSWDKENIERTSRYVVKQVHSTLSPKAAFVGYVAPCGWKMTASFSEECSIFMLGVPIYKAFSVSHLVGGDTFQSALF